MRKPTLLPVPVATGRAPTIGHSHARAAMRAALVAALLTACLGAQAQAPGTPPAAAANEGVDPALMARASDVLYAREITRLRTAQTLNADSRVAARARRLAIPLVAPAKVINPSAGGWSWSVNVETRAEPFVWVLPNGQMLLTSGLVTGAGLTDAELSAIVAHAVAHQVAGHDARDASIAYKRLRDDVDPDQNRAAVALADILAKQVANAHYSQADEQRADALAIELLARAGIDPAVAAGAWRKLAQTGSSRALLALHPVSPERIAGIEAQLATAAPLYQAALAEAAAPRPPQTMEPPRQRPPKRPGTPPRRAAKKPPPADATAPADAPPPADNPPQ